MIFSTIAEEFLKLGERFWRTITVYHAMTVGADNSEILAGV